MEKVSLWKRVGGWLHGSHESVDSAKVVRLDAEGLLVEPLAEAEKDNNSALAARSGRKDQQLTAMEDGFGRLVEVLESINDNVVRQREQGGRLGDRLDVLARIVPETLQSQQALMHELDEHIRGQSLGNQQLSEGVMALGELGRSQATRLGEISHQLAASGETDIKLVESFNRMDGSIKGMSDNAGAQSVSLTNIARLLEQNDARLERILSRQTRRFTWLVTTALVVGLAAAVMAVLVVLKVI